MTIPEFLAELSLTPFKWTGAKRIRSVGPSDDSARPVSDDCECPISAVWNVRHPNGRHPLEDRRSAYLCPVSYGGELGLSGTDAATIVAAADLDPDYNREVRAQLLKACGL